MEELPVRGLSTSKPKRSEAHRFAWAAAKRLPKGGLTATGIRRAAYRHGDPIATDLPRSARVSANPCGEPTS
jgi:hypothetical protein